MTHAPRFPPPHSIALLSPEPKALCSAFLFGVSHSLVVHKLWVLVVVGSNPATPTNNFNRLRVSPTSPETRPPTYSSTSHRVSGQGSGRQGLREAALFDAHVGIVLRHAFIGMADDAADPDAVRELPGNAAPSNGEDRTVALSIRARN